MHLLVSRMNQILPHWVSMQGPRTEGVSLLIPIKKLSNGLLLTKGSRLKSSESASCLTDESTGVSIQFEGASSVGLTLVVVVVVVVAVVVAVVEEGRLQQTSLYPEHVLSLSQPELDSSKTSSPLSSTKVSQYLH